MSIGSKLSTAERWLIEEVFLKMAAGAGRAACEDTLKNYLSR